MVMPVVGEHKPYKSTTIFLLKEEGFSFQFVLFLCVFFRWMDGGGLYIIKQRAAQQTKLEMKGKVNGNRMVRSSFGTAKRRR
jgi:hypothetical protein